jgi:hypothetical protein
MDNRIYVAIGTGAGLAAGAVGGYFFAKKRMQRDFDEALKAAVDEEASAIAEHYRILNKKDEYDSPEKILARRVPHTPAGLDDSIHEGPPVEDVEKLLDGLKKWNYGDPSQNHILGQPQDKAPMGQPRDPRPPISLAPFRDPKAPYQIPEDAYLQGDDEYDQSDLAWYSGDGVLAGGDDDEPYDIEETLGIELKLEMFGDETVIYFRNPKLRTDFEVHLKEMTYSEMVLGKDPEVA